jgi:anti-sigma factor RsiW
MASAAERGGHVQLLLGAYVLGGLSEAEETAVRAHLDRCALCRAEHEELAEVPPWLDLLASAGLPGDDGDGDFGDDGFAADLAAFDGAPEDGHAPGRRWGQDAAAPPAHQAPAPPAHQAPGSGTRPLNPAPRSTL